MEEEKPPQETWGETLGVIIPAHQFHVIIVGKRAILPGNAEENVETKEGDGTMDMEANRWRIWPNLWQ